MVYPDFNISIESFQNICRVCLSRSDDLISIDEIRLIHSYRNGFETELSVSDVFREYCNIQVKCNDSKPSDICRPCTSWICQAYSLFKLFVQSNVILDTVIERHKLKEANQQIKRQDTQPLLKHIEIFTRDDVINTNIFTTEYRQMIDDSSESSSYMKTDSVEHGEAEFKILAPESKNINNEEISALIEVLDNKSAPTSLSFKNDVAGILNLNYSYQSEECNENIELVNCDVLEWDNTEFVVENTKNINEEIRKLIENLDISEKSSGEGDIGELSNDKEYYNVDSEMNISSSEPGLQDTIPKYVMVLPENKKISDKEIMAVLESLNKGDTESVDVNSNLEDDICNSDLESIHEIVIGDSRLGISKNDEEYSNTTDGSDGQDLPVEASAWWDHTYSVLDETFPGKDKADSLEAILPQKRKGSLTEETESKRQKVTSDTDVFNCNVCENTQLHGMEKVIDHIKEVHSLSRKCILCPKELNRLENVIFHVACHSESGNLVCRKCLLYFKDSDSLQQHRISHDHKATFSCDQCDKLFTTRQSWRSHIEEIHLQQGKDLFQCWICGLVLKYARNYKKHIQRHNSVPKYKAHSCEMCAKRFTNAANLKLHVVKVHKKVGEKPKRIYSCEFCPRTFNNRGPFFTHRISHPECNSINCLFCDKVFGSAKEYNNHRRADHSSHVCDLCSKGFPTKAILTNHLYLHKVDLRCSYCNASFKTRAACKKHEYIHTDEKPFQCPYCYKKFKQQTHMNQHVECIHTGKRFKCDQCEKSFVFDCAYRDHLRSHSGRKPFICPYCGKDFRDTSRRHKHVKSEHPERMEEFLIFKKTYQEEEVRKADLKPDNIPERSEYIITDSLQESKYEDEMDLAPYNHFSLKESIWSAVTEGDDFEIPDFQ